MNHFTVLLLALALDAVLGDPPALYRRIPHPVVAIGAFIDAGERRFNHGPRPWRLATGALLTATTVAVAALTGGLIAALLGWLPGSGLLEAAVAGTLLAGRSLHDHVRAVADGLRESLAAGREAVARIVGRDPARLDTAGVARAAVESCAENFSDGLVAPAFWFALAGLPGIAAYKAVNTLDSMIGHHGERFEAFGRAAARLDDLANGPPARLAGGLIVAAAWLMPSASGRRAWTILRHDAGKHRSPNAGWPEAALAGALGFRLAGPRHYAGHTVADPWLGDGRSELDAADIDRALRLYIVAAALLALIVAVLAGLA